MTKTRKKAIHEYFEMKLNNCFNTLSVSALLTERKIKEKPDNVLIYAGDFCSEVKRLLSAAGSEMTTILKEQHLVLSAKDNDMIKRLCGDKITREISYLIEKIIKPAIQNVDRYNRTIETALNVLAGNTVGAFLEQISFHQLTESLRMDDEAIKQRKKNNRLVLCSTVFAAIALLISILTFLYK